MQTFLPGTNVTLTIPLVDASGVALAPLAVEWRLTDVAGVELVVRAALAGYTPGDAEAVVTVPAAQNALPVDVTSTGRVVELFVQLETGWVGISETYRIAGLERLAIPKTSFMLYPEAMIVAADLPDLGAWATASKADRENALMEAKLRIARIKFRYRYWDSMWQSRVEPTLTVGDLDLITLSEFNSLPVDFKDALRKAQVIEADYILSGNDVKNRRDEGVLSETIGESSMMFRPGKPLRSVVCDRAFRTLSKYIENGRSLGRA